MRWHVGTAMDIDQFGVPFGGFVDVSPGGGPDEITSVPIDLIDSRQRDVHPETVEEYADRRVYEDRHVELVERGGRYVIVDGHHRVAAAAMAGETQITANVYR